MLIEAKRLADLSFGELMRVYEYDNLEQAKGRWPYESMHRQLALAEADAYEALLDFFAQPGAVQYIWMDRGRYRSALRLEPYRDGLLLTGLSTAPADQGMGYATALIHAVLEQQDRRIYSHIDNANRASIRVHEKCGFHKISDSAVLLDGSASTRMGTYCFENI